VLGVFGLIYLGAAWWIEVPELEPYLNRIRRFVK
jgi:hypothetical protein